MQDVDYEMRYEPGKDEADSMDFLSRHPLPETGQDETEHMIKSLTETEPAIVLRKIREATAQDCTLKKLSEIIHEGNWMEYRKDPDIVPFISIKDELYQAKYIPNEPNRPSQEITKENDKDRSRNGSLWKNQTQTDVTLQVLLSNDEHARW